MKVIYRGRPSRRSNAPLESEGDAIELLSNDWDDFGFKTSFPTVCRFKGKVIELGMIRLLIDGETNSAAYLDRLRKQGWNGDFPIPDKNYVSVPAAISFYEQLMAALRATRTVKVAKLLRDASYLVNMDDPAALALVGSKGFVDSLQRERGSQKAFIDTWRILDSEAISVLDLGFSFDDVCGGQSILNLKFQGDGLLPHDVNALIGPNGVGKSRVLHHIVEDWISPSKVPDRGFTKKPNLSQVVVVCYSPFENFPVDLEGKSLQDKDAYRYYGLRGRGDPRDGSGIGKIRWSHTFPKRNSASALIECLSDDQRYGSIHGWAKKVRTVETTLRNAFPFDYAAVQVDPRRRANALYRDSTFIDPLHIDVGQEGEAKRRYIPIASDRIDELDEEKLHERVLLEEGVTFFRNGKPVHLSSGQRLFSYVVINILGAIRRNSLILVDEPELFLHPTLEIQFVDLLKRILMKFNSKALLATHSEVTVREIPARCVHVFEKTDDGLVIKQPPFQTFGGDVQRISSYVFGDRAATKPFEQWIKDKIAELGSGEELLERLGDQVNEELVIQIRAQDRQP